MKHLSIVGLGLVLGLAGCKPEPAEKPRSRFAAVKKARATAQAAKFCEKSYPASSRKWSAPAGQPIPGYQAPESQTKKGWVWVNLWASWCGPCVKEMPLLQRWGEALRKEGHPVRFELWSIDEKLEELASALGSHPHKFGAVRWVNGPEAVPTLLESLGVDKDSAIPIHALIDPKGDLRCVRVGAVHEGSYGAVKAMLQGS